MWSKAGADPGILVGGSANPLGVAPTYDFPNFWAGGVRREHPPVRQYKGKRCLEEDINVAVILCNTQTFTETERNSFSSPMINQFHEQCYDMNVLYSPFTKQLCPSQ